MENCNIFSKVETLNEIKLEIEDNGQNLPVVLPHRLNDFDSKILEEKAYIDIKDHMLKLEFRIGVLEKDLARTDDEILDAKNIDAYNDLNLLYVKRRTIEAEINELNSKYEELDLSTKLSGGIAAVLSKKPKYDFQVLKMVPRTYAMILSKISKRFNSGQTLKSALQKLSSINKNVDELLTLQTPYGETVQRYEKLTHCLTRANFIHYSILKNVDNLK